MTAKAVTNRLREAREAKGLSQGELARRVGLTRQAVYSIETNRYQPNVSLALRLAELLGASVEEMFGGDPQGKVVEGERLGQSSTRSEAPASGAARAAVWTLRRRTLVLPLSSLGPPLSYTTPADGLILPRERTGPLPANRVRVRLLGGGESFADNVVVAGCDPAIHIVDERLRRERAPGRLVAWPMGSLAALEALKRGEVHVAGLHVVDPRSGESNVPFVKRHLGAAAVTLVTFAAWEAGLLVPPSNPKRCPDSATWLDAACAW
jgi:DNA-binding XRE family transcriptional regulator